MSSDQNSPNCKSNKQQTQLIPKQRCSSYNLKNSSAVYEKTLIINCNFRLCFLKKLVREIDNYVMFEGKAMLRLNNRENNEVNKAPQISRNVNSTSLTELNEYLISYRLDMVQREGLEQERDKKIVQFERICHEIHKILSNNYGKVYSIEQNKLLDQKIQSIVNKSQWIKSRKEEQIIRFREKRDETKVEKGINETNWLKCNNCSQNDNLFNNSLKDLISQQILFNKFQVDKQSASSLVISKIIAPILFKQESQQTYDRSFYQNANITEQRESKFYSSHNIKLTIAKLFILDLLQQNRSRLGIEKVRIISQ